MIIFISDILDVDTLSSLREAASGLRYEPGAATAGWHARQVKANAQAEPSAVLRQIQRQVSEALRRHEVFRAAVQPARIAPPLISRYGPGDSYGWHVDDAILGDPPLRSDLSVTLFLSDPEGYDGGELVLQAADGDEAIKLPAGAAAVYPSTYLHRVNEVSAGERLAAVTWAQSLVRSTEDRAMLFELEQARRAEYDRAGKSPDFDRLARIHANLLRRWAEV